MNNLMESAIPLAPSTDFKLFIFPNEEDEPKHFPYQ